MPTNLQLLILINILWFTLKYVPIFFETNMAVYGTEIISSIYDLFVILVLAFVVLLYFSCVVVVVAVLFYLCLTSATTIFIVCLRSFVYTNFVVVVCVVRRCSHDCCRYVLVGWIYF